MPIYEFYCPRCHVVFQFLSKAIRPGKRPACPRCARPRLDRRPSTFAVSRGRAEAGEGGDDLPPGFDESRMERAVESLAREAERIDENDPRAMASLMRRLYESTGMRMGEGIEEALRRMEAGEDPDEIDAELGDALEEEDPWVGSGTTRAAALRRRLRPPQVDPTLYEL